EDLDPAIAGTSRRRGIVGDRLVGAAAVDLDAAAVDAARDEVVARAGRAAHRQRIVDRVIAGAVGVADDRHDRVRMLVERLREAIEHGAQGRIDLRAVGGERNIARDFQAQAVVRRLAHADAGALGGLLHRLALLLHVARPDIAAQRAGGRADHGAAPRPAAGARDRATAHRARDRADAGAGGGALLGLAHAGAAAQR